MLGNMMKHELILIQELKYTLTKNPISPSNQLYCSNLFCTLHLI